MKIVTWNLRMVWKNGDGINDFIHRAGFIYEKIMEEKPSVIAFQEVVPNSLEFLKRVLVEYEFIGGMRTENYDGEGVYTAFLKEEFIQLSSDFFWLSPTPYVPASRFEEQSVYPRVCVYNKVLYKKTNKVFNFFNLHLDNTSQIAMLKGFNCVLEYIEKNNTSIDKNATIILGDFNAEENSITIKSTNKLNWIVDVTKGIKETFHGFGKIENNKIDYIFISKCLVRMIETVDVWKDEINGIYLSDHYPICLKLFGDN